MGIIFSNGIVDGTYNNTACQDGVYTYKIWFGDKETDAKYTVTGHITLIR